MGCCRNRNTFDDFYYRGGDYYGAPYGYNGYNGCNGYNGYNYPERLDNRCRRNDDFVFDVHLEVPDRYRGY